MDYRAKHLAVDIAELLRKCSAGKVTHRQSALASITAYEMLTHDNTYPLENMLKDLEKGTFSIEVNRWHYAGGRSDRHLMTDDHTYHVTLDSLCNAKDWMPRWKAYIVMQNDVCRNAVTVNISVSNPQLTAVYSFKGHCWSKQEEAEWIVKEHIRREKAGIERMYHEED